MRSFLQGKWLGQPLHPVLVHIPIGLFVLAFVCDLLFFLTGNPGMRNAAFYLILFGVIAGALASVPGFADYASIRRDSAGKRHARAHMFLNLAALLLYLVSFLHRAAVLDTDRTPFAAFLVAVLAFGVLCVSGYIGGKLVYEDGVGVGRHRRSAPLPGETVIRPNAADWEYVPVANVAGVESGGTVRARINGTVVAIVKLEDQLFAFQEYCTHRYAPLSEGSFQGTEVRCPWHNSCFDIRTGKVTRGPATVDLKVFPVRIRDGKIEVQAEGPQKEEEGEE